MPRRPRPTIRRRRVAREVKKLMDAAGFTPKQLAELFECQMPKVYKVLNAKAGFNPSELARLLDKLEVEQPLYGQLVAFNRESRVRGLVQEHSEAAPEYRRPYLVFEQDADELAVFENELVHGLLQTPEYAYTVIAEMAPGMSDEDVHRRVGLRMARQRVLTEDEPLVYWVILTEAVLRIAVGGPKVMVDQLHQLIALAKLKNVTMQVLPQSAGAHAAMGSPFTILGFDDEDDLDLVYVEDIATSHLLEKPEQLAAYTVAFNRLRAAALSPESSVALLQQVANEWSAQETGG